MISRVYQLCLFLFLALPLFAGATVLLRDGIDNTCNTGSLQCCNSVQEASQNPFVDLLRNLGLLVNVGPITGQVGLTCNPITVDISIGGNSCTAQPACCTGNTYIGLITTGCRPLNINL
ncbi:hypothetical protein CVT24_012576 [Panaeolus cyanescens]|uniref:Hydrophobin n=1 Tax=Panaeolus cyanescens TaxID=181874 RepID=A0A409YJY9_9AGAR|nr:hypothetical protein CVT24_012576 [Panaeolus cyanescens]